MLEAKRSGLSAGAQLPAVTKAVLMPLCIQGLLPRVKKSHGGLLFSAPAPFHTFQHFQIPQSAAAFDALWKRGGCAFIVS